MKRHAPPKISVAKPLAVHNEDESDFPADFFTVAAEIMARVSSNTPQSQDKAA